MISFAYSAVILWFLLSTQNFGGFLKSISAQTTGDISEWCNYSTDQFIRLNGYEAEVYNVITKDEYILTIFRCFLKKHANTKRMPVLLAHGLLSSSDAYVMNPGNQSLAYFLADEKYDVWLTNSRGNRYSRKHLTKNPDDPTSGFWNFTWNEMGTLDHPATINFILSKTGFDQLSYIGHSQGTTSLLVLLSSLPEYNCKIRVASLMAPIAFMGNIGYKVKAFCKPFGSLRGKQNTEFTLSNSFFSELYSSLCPGDGCDVGMSLAQLNVTMAPIYGCRQSGASVNQFMHYDELIEHRYFGEFVTDTINPEGFTNTNNYDLSNICADITLHVSRGDATTNLTDIAELVSKVKSIKYEQIVEDDTFAHGDFALGIAANKLVYRYIANFWKKLRP